jgi:p-aminobenzoyl-glutamate transporter AbgT
LSPLASVAFVIFVMNLSAIVFLERGRGPFVYHLLDS